MSIKKNKPNFEKETSFADLAPDTLRQIGQSIFYRDYTNYIHLLQVSKWFKKAFQFENIFPFSNLDVYYLRFKRCMIRSVLKTNNLIYNSNVKMICSIEKESSPLFNPHQICAQIFLHFETQNLYNRSVKKIDLGYLFPDGTLCYSKDPHSAQCSIFDPVWEIKSLFHFTKKTTPILYRQKSFTNKKYLIQNRKPLRSSLRKYINAWKNSYTLMENELIPTGQHLEVYNKVVNFNQ